MAFPTAWEKVQDGLASALFTGPSDAWDKMASSMPSMRTFAKAAFGGAQLLLGYSDTVRAGSLGTCSNPQFSCQNTTAVQDLCCFNAPGGQLLQTQFWDTNPSTGPSNSWTVHGLWPDHCDGTFDANCDPNRAYTNITSILQSFGKTDLLSYMQTYWPDYQGNDESFWEHEWGKHGTCINTIDPNCYSDYTPTQEVPDFFQKTVDLFKTLPSYQWLAAAGITPSTTQTYAAADIQAALSKNRGGHQVTLGCASGALDEIWYHYNVAGNIISGDYQAADPDGSKSTCPSTGIKYLPKSGSSASSSTTLVTSTTKTTSSQPTSTGGAFSGKGYLNVVTGGSQTGCIISGGTWYTSGTCATFTATSSGSTFTLKSSKGPCAVSAGTLVCSSSTTATSFTSDGGYLASGGSSTFYADSVPSGSTQATVYTSSHATSLQIQWQGA